MARANAHHARVCWRNVFIKMAVGVGVGGYWIIKKNIKA
jgi:hypothetical protein